MTREAQMTINDIRRLADKWHNWNYLGGCIRCKTLTAPTLSCRSAFLSVLST